MADDLNNAEERIQALIRERNAARSDLQEARAEIASLTEQGTATQGATEAAGNAARAERQAKITELDSQKGTAAKKQKKEYSKQLGKLESRLVAVADETKQLARFEEEKQNIQAQRDKLMKK